MEENVIQIDGRITINIDWGAKKWHVCEKDYVWNPATCSYKNRKYLASIMEDWEDSAITCDELIKSFDEEKHEKVIKKVACKPQNFYILLSFLLITIALLITASIECYLIKY